MSARKRGLGRGLDALIVRDDSSLRTLPIDRLQPNRLQPRSEFEEEALSDLAASIRSQGIVQPIVVSPDGEGRYSIIAGERRWRAARMAGLIEVPVVIREVADDRERLELALVENLQRSDLNPMEEAEAYQLLRERFSLSQEEIGERVGKGRTTITNSLRLLRLPPGVCDLLREGSISAGQARPLLALEDSAQQVALARRAVDEKLSAREMESLVAASREPVPRKKTPPKVDVHAAAAAEKLTRKFQTKVEIRRRGAGGSVVIHYHSEEELMRLYDTFMGKGR